ncbi:chromate transporter [Brevibacillus choshinensis]|uniref:chromate transporter n=1 Tax=Brevibacillus choshinensis TaxID=54911 RepID=UPI002E2424C7|nr:chromate transporter [Brevibacillus choshinensis]
MDGNRQKKSKGKGKLGTLLEILYVSTKLGVTSFGGPIAHLGYFHDEYIRRRKWMDERSYTELVALSQFLPGPASSQVGIGIGIVRAGWLGGLVAWLGFTLPSVLALVAFAFLLQGYDIGNTGWIHGLKLVAVAIVAHAILGMGQKLTPDRTRATIAIVAAAVTLLWQTAFSQIIIILLAGLLGVVIFGGKSQESSPDLQIPISRSVAIVCLALFFGLLLVALPLLREWSKHEWIVLFDGFYRSGALVFGGGHVVLPLLERELVPAGWITKEEFLTGYGAAQAVPGPLFTFSSYLGALAGGVTGAIIATIAIFLPAFLLVMGALPFWSQLRNSSKMQGGLMGVNAAVVGILLASLYDPLWTSAVLQPKDFILAVILFGMLVFWKLPPWMIVMVGALGGTVLGYL